MTLRTIGRAAAGTLAPLFASSVGQSIVEQGIRFLEWMQGVGSGAALSRRAYRAVFSLVSAPTPVIFDVGANRGQFLQAALSQRGSDTFQLHAFEPSRCAFRELSNWAGAMPNVSLNCLALSSTGGTGVLFYDVSGSELSSLTPRTTVNLDESEGVQLDTLDDYCAAHAIESIHLLKLDVEGHELEVLRGAQNMFRHAAIRAVLFEFGGCNIDARVFFLDLYSFFTKEGMQISRLTPSGYLYSVGKYSESLERFRTTNYLATY